MVNIVTEFTFTKKGRALGAGGSFGRNITEITIENNKMQMYRYKKLFFFIDCQKNNTDIDIEQIEEIELVKKVNKFTPFMIIIAILGMSITGGLSAAFILVFLTGFYEKNININMKDKAVIKIKDIATDYYVPKLVMVLKEINSEIKDKTRKEAKNE